MVQRHQRRQQRDLMPIFLLFTQLQRFGLDRIPPISLMIGIVNAIVLFILEQVPLHEVCLNPHAIINFGDYHRLVLSAFFHADTWHFYHNMASLLWKGTRLENQMGSHRFFIFTILSVILSNLMYVLLGMYVFPGSFNSCAVGFSAVLFAYKVVLTANDNGESRMLGMPLPTKYLAWAELFYISYIFPQASFLGHLCGCLVGVLYVNGFLDPIVNLHIFNGVLDAMQNPFDAQVRRPGRGEIPRGQQRRRRFVNNGVLEPQNQERNPGFQDPTLNDVMNIMGFGQILQ